MAKSVPAIVQPSVLAWARKSAGYSLEEAAKKLQTTPEKLNSWETGKKPPSIAKVRKMVAVYKRPLHFFFFDEPPVDPPIPHDFRRLPVGTMSRLCDSNCARPTNGGKLHSILRPILTSSPPASR
jgi:transcriptional regulator with XRE-family HTH domain